MHSCANNVDLEFVEKCNDNPNKTLIMAHSSTPSQIMFLHKCIIDGDLLFVGESVMISQIR